LNGISNSIIGDGIVQAANYSYADQNNTIYGVQPAAGQKAAGGTWEGLFDNNWFNADNWGRNRIPSGNTSVIISIDFASTTWPSINSTENTAAARSVEIDGNGANIQLGNNGILEILQTGNSPNSGIMIIGDESDCIILGGELTIDNNLNVETNASLNISSGGVVNVGGDVNVASSGNVAISGTGSSLTIGQ
jgi:hypothetical protein